MSGDGGGGARILLVEDELIVAMYIEQALKRLGYRVVGVVDTGRGAIDRALAERPDLVLMDIRLKDDIDGIAAAREIHRHIRVPVVFLTAYADEPTIERAKAAGAYGYVLKPFQKTELHTTIEVALHKHHTVESRQQELTAALTESEERFRLMVESTTDYAIFMLDPTGRVTSWNTSSSGACVRSSIQFPSDERPQRLSSIEYGVASVPPFTGIPCSRA